ncbi:MAG TPA: surface carbohydrate biosynthesis protein [Burkholderiales bacterium]
MATARQPIVYLPVEFQAREFDSKTFLAAALAQRGYAVVLGQQWMLLANLDRLPPGAILFKSFNKIHQPAMAAARAAGHRVFALEEELLAQVDEKAIVSLCTEGIFTSVDMILAHGDFERDILRRLAAGRTRVETAGNGRVDLLKPRYRAFFAAQVDELRLRYGDYVLVNTNLPVLNSIWNSVEQVTEIQAQAGFIDKNDPVSMQGWRDYLAFEEANLAAIKAAVLELARRRPAQKILVRPHPGEDLRMWQAAFPACPNVVVVREGSHVPWTLGCRVLLHTSCTTGFEANVAGRAALSLVPRTGWISESLMSNRVNPVFRDPLALVQAAERVLDGGTTPAAAASREAPEHFVWNYDAHLGVERLAALLTEGLPAPGPVTLPPLQGVSRDERLALKFTVSPQECAANVQRIAEVAGMKPALEVRALGESLFLVAPASLASRIASAAPIPDYAQLRRAIEGACQAGKFQQAVDLFRHHFSEAHRHPDLCFFAGVALFELGKPALALQYFQTATAAANAVNPDLAYWMARAYHRLGDLESGLRLAEQAYRQMPLQPGYYDFFKELALRTGKEVPEHWLVIGCSHVRYFRYLQLNHARFFAQRVHLDCYEFGGATAYGLGHADSQAGALKATRQLRPRIAQSARVLVYFGEVDCRRAAWKAAATSGRPIEEMIAESAARLEAYIAQEILPHNRNVVLLGAKPQIIADADFYRNTLVDERTVFQPLAERERVTLMFNALARQAAARLKVDYADIDHVLADEKSRQQFFKKAFWDGYSDDTHGNVDYFATLYYQRLQEFL